MAFWDRFRRSGDEETDNDYYREEPGEGRGRLASVLYGLTAFLLTVLIAAGVVLGIRTIYRAIKGGSGTSQTTNVPDNNNTSGSTSGKSKTKSSSGAKRTSGGSRSSTPSTGDNLPSTGDNISLPKTGDPGM